MDEIWLTPTEAHLKLLEIYPDSVKILVTGVFSSGKTEFIRSISEVEVNNVEWEIVRNETEILRPAITTGIIKIDETALAFFYETPGAMRVQTLVESICSVPGFIGTVIMVDSARHVTFREAHYIFQQVYEFSSMPIVIAANKQDFILHIDPQECDFLYNSPNSPELLRVLLDIPDNVPVLPCIATEKDSVKKVVLALLDEVLKELETDE